MMDLDELGAWMDRYATAAAFRLETRQAYEVASDGSDFKRYLDNAPSWTPERKEPWLAHLRAERDAGFYRHRVRIVARPVTEYTRYEAEWGYLPNTEAGEDVRILDLGQQDMPAGIGAFGDSDWWLVTDRAGDRQVAVMHYDADGTYLGADHRDSRHVSAFVGVRDKLWAAARPFRTWWDANPELHRAGQRAA